jgi:hypothetical protein
MTVKVKFALGENRLAGGHVKVVVRAIKGNHIRHRREGRQCKLGRKGK